MLFKELMDRINNAEVAIVESINGRPPAEFISRNFQHFQHLTIQDDYEKAGIFWIFDPAIRSNTEFNP